ncbi:MAG: Trehalose transport system permease protein SugB [Spirochaetes bacterium ADurb.Bin315]|jgi:raffinose/stachyose/melibiose transport system permease protein|nr:carbohydrate ABC transporter permease [Spirochaetota bacterium]OQA43615.1 MAG: Trehalose transport system permease protein SugB [Spirochaetes bacterium ADurb.Bin315]
MDMRKSIVTGVLHLLKWVLLLFLLALALLPIVWLMISSLRTNLELQTSPFGWPRQFQWVNYSKALHMASLPRLLLNSVTVAAFAVLINTLVTSMASFILAREVFKGRDLIYTIFTAGVLIPVISFMVPYFSLITKSGLYNTLTALVLVYASVNIPVSIFLVTAFMKSIPKELEEASVIDGCGFFKRFSTIILPLSRSGIVTAATFCFIYSWNEFVMAMLLTSSIESRTVQLGIKFFTSQFITDYAGMYAAVVITIIPSVVGYVLLHNKIIGGLTAGGVKG